MNKSQTPRFLVKTLKEVYNGIIDPVTIIRKRTSSELLLFESADVVTRLGEKSLLFLDIAVKFESRDHEVKVTALMPEGLLVLNALQEVFQSEPVSDSADSASFRFAPLYHQLDLLKKLRTPSALDVLRKTMFMACLLDSEQKRNFMLAGAFSYDFLDHFEKLPKPLHDRANVPDYIFYLPLTVVVIDHKAGQTSVFAHGLIKTDNDASADIKTRLDSTYNLVLSAKDIKSKSFIKAEKALNFQVDIADKDFKELVEKCKSHILAGDVYQIVPSRMFSLPIRDPLHCYQALRCLNPSPYMFYMKALDWTLFGASPETFIKVDKRGGRVCVRPIAGTRRRGFNADGVVDEELDSREQASLCLDEKELAEHMMLVDLARNDIATVCRPKSRRIKRLLAVDRFSHVMHLVSEVEGVLLNEFDALSAYQASMNMGTLMGAPKVRSAELLRELEPYKRGFYGGAVGYLDLLGNMDTSIIIRSALVKGDTAHVRAGCGVVYDSTPQFETQETINKAEAVLFAITVAEAL